MKVGESGSEMVVTMPARSQSTGVRFAMPFSMLGLFQKESDRCSGAGLCALGRSSSALVRLPKEDRSAKLETVIAIRCLLAAFNVTERRRP